eukprot:COSAG01_NODE_52352_length_347_cov_0.790323_1_plen_43_part_10
MDIGATESRLQRETTAIQCGGRTVRSAGCAAAACPSGGTISMV